MSLKTVNSFHHVQFYVSNALQVSFWYCFNLGFERFAIRRTNKYSEIAVKNSAVILLFKSPLLPNDPVIGPELLRHGDFAKDVAFNVDDLEDVISKLKGSGCKVLNAPEIISDGSGSLLTARISGSSGSIVHTLIQNINYTGLFLPGFHPIKNFSCCLNLSRIDFFAIDHVVEAHPEGTMDNVIEWYNKTLKMKRFWSIDDKLVHAEFSALRAVLVGNQDVSVKMTIVEPVTLQHTRRAGQVQEYLNFHDCSGVQHIAFTTDDICKVVEIVRERAIEFLDIPDSYYDMLEKRLASSNIKVTEDLNRIRKLKILVDFDDNGYLLQIFTKPVQDRPTLFLEIIQRHNYDGFGAGNFQALFAAVELEQKKREELIS